jgi:putative nucleotidyltransferase with HDIG domain
MLRKNVDAAVVQHVEGAIRQLDSLSILPSVGAGLFTCLLESKGSTAGLAEIIESDPALSATVFSIMHQHKTSFADENFSIYQAIGKLSPYVIRNAFFSVEVSEASQQDSIISPSQKELTLHAIAVACCAEDIANIISPQMDPRLAYSAGLLHDVGKLALSQSMPKSFGRIAEEAKSQNASSCTIEQKHLGMDHSVLGKRLAQKWHLPMQITLAIWLHHSDTCSISRSVPEARIAQITQLADLLARQCSIGCSGSYDEPSGLAERVARSLGISDRQLQQIRNNLGAIVSQKSTLLGLDLPDPVAAYNNAVQAAAARFALDSSKLARENHRLQAVYSHFTFVADFLSSINSTAEAIETARAFATQWQTFYQTGAVCIYLAGQSRSKVIEAVVADNADESRIVYLKAPEDQPAIPQQIARDFAILNADERIDWLLEQLDVDFEVNQTKLVPLISDGKAIGAIVFEFRYPAEAKGLEENFRVITHLAAQILEITIARQNQQQLAEEFVPLITGAEAISRQTVPDIMLVSLAEMAAGAAHELNNPLSVISGRTQLLSESETKAEKKQVLKQINENTRKISQIIDNLLSFAEPPQPKPTQTSIKQIIDEAIKLTGLKKNIKQLDIQIDLAGCGRNVFVDSAQVVSAIANIFANSLESYTGGAGPVKVQAADDELTDSVKLRISDLGCGMDSETLRKATYPFFSAKPAGRKRGMGLAHASRLIKLNAGFLDIESRLAGGTTVTIALPCK